MEDTSLNHEDKQYSETLDLPVNCAGGDCIPTEAVRWALLTLLVVIFLVGMLGNVMISWVTKLGFKQNISWFYYLALPDMFCCLSLPAMVLRITLWGHWPYGVTGCRALPFIAFLSMYTKVLLLTVLSADIFLLTLKSNWWTYNRRSNWVRIFCLAAWILGYLLAMPLDVYYQVFLETYPSQLDCVLDYNSWTVAATAIQFLFGFLVPLVVMASCHGALWCIQGRHRWPQGMAAAVCFLICWAPYHVLALVITMGDRSSTLWTWALLAEPFVVGPALAHSCLNPMLILYFGRAHHSTSLSAAWDRVLKDPGSDDESEIRRSSSSHDQVSEMEKLERN